MPHTVQAPNHNVYVGNDCFQLINEFVNQEKYKNSKIFILVDENTHQHCLPPLLINVEAIGRAEIIEIESGEENKNIHICSQVWEALTDLKADRKSLFINLGGGVIGDMGGFIASTFKRGIDFINIPTTLLSQVDASVGGKTGIDLNSIKNQIGLFAFPQAVYIIPEFLETLPFEQIRSGFAEIIKHGLIADSDYWDKIQLIKDLEDAPWEELILQSVRIKNKVVTEDPREKGLRKILNFGHTIGHAIESYSLDNDKKPLLHGEAIAIGMIAEGYLSVKNAGLSSSEFQKITTFIQNFYPTYNLKEKPDNGLLELMKNDKKNEQERISFALLKKVGETDYNSFCTPDQIIEALDFYRSQC